MKTLAIALFVMLAACGKKKDAPPSSGSSAPGTASAVAVTDDAAPAGSAATPDEPAGEEVDVPTAMDYEELASEEITEQTVEARLRALESQLAIE